MPFFSKLYNSKYIPNCNICKGTMVPMVVRGNDHDVYGWKCNCNESNRIFGFPQIEVKLK